MLCRRPDLIEEAITSDGRSDALAWGRLCRAFRVQTCDCQLPLFLCSEHPPSCHDRFLVSWPPECGWISYVIGPCLVSKCKGIMSGSVVQHEIGITVPLPCLKGAAWRHECASIGRAKISALYVARSFAVINGECFPAGLLAPSIVGAFIQLLSQRDIVGRRLPTLRTKDYSFTVDVDVSDDGALAIRACAFHP